jgi:hypothetical protein
MSRYPLASRMTGQPDLRKADDVTGDQTRPQHFFNSPACVQGGDDDLMEQFHRKTSSRGQSRHGASAVRSAADSRALALASTLRELMAAGFVSQRALANELNRTGMPTVYGGRWHHTTVVRILSRVGLLTSENGRINNGLANKHAADLRAEVLAPTIYELRKAGVISTKAIARELNEREIPTARGGKWHPASVSRLLHRLADSTMSNPNNDS